MSTLLKKRGKGSLMSSKNHHDQTEQKAERKDDVHVITKEKTRTKKTGTKPLLTRGRTNSQACAKRNPVQSIGVNEVRHT